MEVTSSGQYAYFTLEVVLIQNETNFWGGQIL